jgi:hypothetical protein
MMNYNSCFRSGCLIILPIITSLLTSLVYSEIALGQTASNRNTLVAQKIKTNLTISSVTHDGVNQILTPGQTLNISVEGTPGMQASVLLVVDKQTVREIPAKEVSPGVYLASIEVTAGDRFIEGAILARLESGNQVVYSAASQTVAFDNQNITNNTSFSFLQPPTEVNLREGNTIPQKEQSLVAANSNLRPVFISHENGDLVDKSGFIVKGQTQPNAEVKIKVTSSLSILGEFITIEGNTLVDKIIIADNKGNFEIQVSPESVSPSGLKYIINAVAVVEGKTSEPIQLTLLQK